MPNLPGEIRRALIGTLAAATGITGTVADDVITTLDLSAEGTIIANNTYLIDNEEVFTTAVTSNASDEATILRGVDGTTGAAHSAAGLSLVNLFTPRIPRGHVPNTELAYFVITSGGIDLSGESASGPKGDIRDIAVDFFCYSDTFVNAWDWYETVRAAILALEQTTPASNNIKFIGAVNTIPGQQLLDPDGQEDGWPYVFSTWNLTIGKK